MGGGRASQEETHYSFLKVSITSRGCCQSEENPTGSEGINKRTMALLICTSKRNRNSHVGKHVMTLGFVGPAYHHYLNIISLAFPFFSVFVSMAAASEHFLLFSHIFLNKAPEKEREVISPLEQEWEFRGTSARQS